MAFMCRDVDALFVLTPRTASTALSAHLNDCFGGGWLPRKDIHDADGRVRVWRKHSTVVDLVDEGFLTEEDLRRVTCFTTVRNPFDSLVSIWVKKKNQYREKLSDPNFFGHKIPGFQDDMDYVQNHSFSEWAIKNHGGEGQSSLYRRYARRCDEILRFERLEEDFQALLAKLGVTAPPIPIVAPTSKKQDFRTYYTEEAAAAVARRYAWDFNAFGYEKDIAAYA